MIDLPVNFIAKNGGAESFPTVIVKLLESELVAEETTAAQWAANSAESNVDYTPDHPVSGDVILSSPGLFEQSTISNAWSLGIMVNTGILVTLSDHWQSFKHSATTTKRMRSASAFIRKSDFTDPAARVDIKCEIWSAGKASVIAGAQTFSQVLPSAVGQYYVFDFSAVNYVIEPNTEYWMRIYFVNATSLDLVVDIAYQNTNVYVNGQLDRTGNFPLANMGDMKFSVIFDYYYSPTGSITTQTMDVGAIPTVNGELVLKDIRPAGTDIVYEAWRSATGVFGGEEFYIGVVIDGQIIPPGGWAQYYRIKATLSTTDRSFTPTIQSIKGTFATYVSYSDRAGFGYEPNVINITPLTTTIDTFKTSTIGQVTVKLGFIKSISDWMKTKYPKNKIVKILIGFKGLAEVDFIDYFWGQVDDWSITSKDEVKFVIKDYKKEWAVDVPNKWVTTADDVVWTAMHPTDVILDILRNQINIRDSKIDISSFDILKATLSGWVVTRTITGDSEQANKLIHELMVGMSAYFIPKNDGKISIKRFDPAEAVSLTLSDDNVENMKWSANAGSIVNNLFVYFNNDGLGTDAVNFSEIRLGSDVTSQVNYDEFASKTMKDLWTRSAEFVQIDDLVTNVLLRYATPPEEITLNTDTSMIALEVGDLVNLTIIRAPSSDMLGISGVVFQVVRRNLDFKADVIKLTLLRA